MNIEVSRTHQEAHGDLISSEPIVITIKRSVKIRVEELGEYKDFGWSGSLNIKITRVANRRTLLFPLRHRISTVPRDQESTVRELYVTSCQRKPQLGRNVNKPQMVLLSKIL